MPDLPMDMLDGVSAGVRLALGRLNDMLNAHGEMKPV